MSGTLYLGDVMTSSPSSALAKASFGINDSFMVKDVCNTEVFNIICLPTIIWREAGTICNLFGQILLKCLPEHMERWQTFNF